MGVKVEMSKTSGECISIGSRDFEEVHGLMHGWI